MVSCLNMNCYELECSKPVFIISAKDGEIRAFLKFRMARFPLAQLVDIGSFVTEIVPGMSDDQSFFEHVSGVSFTLADMGDYSV